MDNSWVMDVEYDVYTKIKYATETDVSALYPSIVYTNDNESGLATTNDYTVYIHSLSPVSVGDDIEGAEINGIRATFECQVICSTNKVDCRKIMAFMVNAFKKYSFEGTMLPVVTKSDNMFVATARFRRIIGYGDTL